MSYAIEIAPSARREWKKLDYDIKQQFLRKLEKLREQPKVPAAKLRGFKDAYRTKLRDAGYRLLYRVIDDRMVIVIVAAGKRDSSKKDIYHIGAERLSSADE